MYKKLLIIIAILFLSLCGLYCFKGAEMFRFKFSHSPQISQEKQTGPLNRMDELERNFATWEKQLTKMADVLDEMRHLDDGFSSAVK